MTAKTNCGYLDLPQTAVLNIADFALRKLDKQSTSCLILSGHTGLEHGVETVTLTLPSIDHDKVGFEALAHLYAQCDPFPPRNIVIDMRATSWIDADMCAPLGGVICMLERRLKRVEFVSAESKLKHVLMRNGFLFHHGGEKITDAYDTTITYQRFNIKDEIAFSSYVVNELMLHLRVVNLQNKLHKDFSKNVSEIFNNATQHSSTQVGVFSCGQFFPTKKSLVFTVADMGIGMHQSVRDFLQRDMPAIEAIKWAVEGNTTKQQQQGVPGGMGLKLISRFFDSNEGYVRIVSGDGYWVKSKGQVNAESLAPSFPGTVVSLEVSTSG